MDTSSTISSGSSARTADAIKGKSGAASEEMSNLKADLDDLVTRVPFLSDVDLNAAKDKLVAKMSAAKKSAIETAGQAKEKFNQGVDATEGMVKDKPFQAIGVAAGVGLVLGLVLARRGMR